MEQNTYIANQLEALGEARRLIKMGLEFHLSIEEIKERLQSELKLTKEEAEEYLIQLGN